MSAEGQRTRQGEADLLERADDGVQTATGRGRHGRGDAPLGLDEEAGRRAGSPLMKM